MRLVGRLLLSVMLAIVAIVGIAAAWLYVEGSKSPDRSGEYVALGSSFAAGPRLGALALGAPHACWRTADNYAHQLARATGLKLVDVSCGGATTRHLLHGGQFFQPPQVDAVGDATRLVTITIGGNDVDYIGDLGLLAWRSRDGVLGWLVRALWDGPRPADARPYEALADQLVEVVDAVHLRSPQAVVAFVTYPQVLPPAGTCAAVEISGAEATLMRGVGARLAAATQAAATRSGALVVDLGGASAGHDACSGDRWVNGTRPRHGDGAMFHPTRAGMRATAELLERSVRDLRLQDRL
jgi:lysophospholipase L1-like esterase